MSDKSCAILVRADRAFLLLSYFPWAVFSGLRTYALCPHHWHLGSALGMLVFLLSSVPIGINFAGYHWLSTEITPILGCVNEVLVPTLQLAKEFTIASRTCLIVADLIVLGVTWRTAYRTTQLARIAVGTGEQTQRHDTYSGTLLRDGTLYFLVLAILNVLHLLFTMLSIASDTNSSISYVTLFTDPITTILVSRFLLDLQGIHQYQADSQLSSSSAGQHSIHFSRAIGSLGSSLPSPGDTWFEDERLEEDASDEYECDEVGHEMDTFAEATKGY
ncbi:hypothetical protein L226DRAFT_613604 [Lentinus tigrinus ALCF2SS1-7]|uniref:uncharacterized protein n=1 Tax=Lentinus tigrinus ALCF2SS1-7 TaxID=1328758 RepID=UPI0011661250|nr:hypothetical protein L226DRAFT_613604 [Lentinus tigrinus ALCF2SS1-7]